MEVQEARMKSEEQELKDTLLRKYGSHIGSLKLDFSKKKKKKEKLPKDARQTLFDWWSSHYNWPYPTVSFLFILFYYYFMLILIYNNCYGLEKSYVPELD